MSECQALHPHHFIHFRNAQWCLKAFVPSLEHLKSDGCNSLWSREKVLNSIMSGLPGSIQHLSICLLPVVLYFSSWVIYVSKFMVWPPALSQMYRSAIQSSGVPVLSRKGTFCQSRRSRRMTLEITPVKSSLVATWSGGQLNSQSLVSLGGSSGGLASGLAKGVYFQHLVLKISTLITFLDAEASSTLMCVFWKIHTNGILE